MQTAVTVTEGKQRWCMIRCLYKTLLEITPLYMWNGSFKSVCLSIDATDLGIDSEVLLCNLCLGMSDLLLEDH